MEEKNEMPVFDRSSALPAIVDKQSDWSPACRRFVNGVTITLANDGPDLAWRHAAQAARLTSNRFSGQAANDNKTWPLEKLLLTEENEHCLRLAKRYRDLHDTATRPTQLVGRESDNLYVVYRQDGDGRAKGVKVVTGKKATADTLPRRAGALTEEARKRAAPVPKKWAGDWPILAAIDAKRELAFVRAHLAFVPKILDAFEWSVVDGLTLDEIGRLLGAGSKGGKGEARARIFDGFTIVDRFWTSMRVAA